MKRTVRQESTRPDVRLAAGVLLTFGSVLISLGAAGCVMSFPTVDPHSNQTYRLPVAMLVAFVGVVFWATAFGITKAASVIETRVFVDWRKLQACPMCGSRLSGPECTDCGEKMEQAGID